MCARVCLRLHTYACAMSAFVCACMWACVAANLCVFVSVFMCMCVCMHAYTYTCTHAYKYVHICMCALTQVHKCMHTRAYVCPHSCMPVCLRFHLCGDKQTSRRGSSHQNAESESTTATMSCQAFRYCILKKRVKKINTNSWY